MCLSFQEELAQEPGQHSKIGSFLRREENITYDVIPGYIPLLDQNSGLIAVFGWGRPFGKTSILDHGRPDF